MVAGLAVLAALFATHIADASVVRDKKLAAVTRTSNDSVLHWGPCDPSIVTDPSISCSFFEVPLDYNDPKAGFGRIAIAKANATGDRVGTIFFNPGGPGVSGLQALDQSSGLLLTVSGGRYDIVSWDPRGVGPLTVPGDIYCFDSSEEYNTFWNGTIELTGIEMTGNFTDPDDINALLSQAPIMQKKYEDLGERCLQHPTGKYLRYLGTAATVRDMVALADALDGPGAPVNYAGISYGTVLGSWFVNMFPERVGRVIVDGVLNPIFLATEETSFFVSNQLADADKVYQGFVTGCALSGPSGCAIATEGQSAADVDADIQTLLQEAHDAARRNSSVPVTSAEVREQLREAMYSPDEWAALANTSYPEAVAAVTAENHSQSGSGTMRRNLHKRQMNDTPSYTIPAILCSDSVDRRGTTMLDIFESIISGSRTASHLFSATWPNPFQYCPFWPVRAVERYQGPFNKTLANKVLVISNTYDPATPLAGARALVDLLGDNARLAVQNGFGHTSMSSPSQCLNKIILAYLTNGTLPADNDTVCQVDTDYEIFNGVNTEAILAAFGPQ
ncbi:TAP-like protein-domain-containing protein [Trametes punicea]|nr:TAP-like protein-domain-containing protein [Trametes punicea]